MGAPRAAREGAEGGAALDWAALPVGGAVAGAVHDVREYGVLCDLEGHPDIVALVSPGQAGAGALVCFAKEGVEGGKRDVA